MKQPLGANPGVCWEPVREQRGFTPPLGWNVKQQLGTNPGVCSEPVGEPVTLGTQPCKPPPRRIVKNTAELKQSNQDTAAKLSASVQDKKLANRLLHPPVWNVKQQLGANPGVCWEPVQEQRGFTPPLGWNVKQQLGTNPGVCSEPVGEPVTLGTQPFKPPPRRTVRNTAELEQSQQDRAAKLSASVQDKQLAYRLLHLYNLSQSSYMSAVDDLRRHQGERLQHSSQPGKKFQNRKLRDVKSEELPQAKKTLAEDDRESLSSSSSSQMGKLQEVISWDDMNDGGRGETGSDKDCQD